MSSTHRKTDQKEAREKMCLLTLDLQQFKLDVKGKHSAGKELQSSRAWLCKERNCLHRHLIIPRNGDRNQNNEWISQKNQCVEPVRPVQMNIYLSNIYRKHLSWLNFNNEPRIQERQHVKDYHFYLPVSVACSTYPSSNWEAPAAHDNSISCKTIQQIYRDKELTQKKETSYNESRLAVCFWATWPTFSLIPSFKMKNTFFASNNRIFIIITYTHTFYTF